MNHESDTPSVVTRSRELGNSELDFRIEIDSLVFHKIMHWINKSEYEVSGLGKIIVDKERNVIRVIDAILLPQENTSTTTDIDGAAVGKAMYLLRDTPGELRWWWHSHVNMSAFWSGTDMGTIRELSKAGWFCATVFNKRREMRSAFSQYSPLHVLIDHVDTHVVQNIDQSLVETWDKDYQENVTNKVHKIQYSGPASSEEFKKWLKDRYGVDDVEVVNVEEEPSKKKRHRAGFTHAS